MHWIQSSTRKHHNHRTQTFIDGNSVLLRKRLPFCNDLSFFVLQQIQKEIVRLELFTVQVVDPRAWGGWDAQQRRSLPAITISLLVHIHANRRVRKRARACQLCFDSHVPERQAGQTRRIPLVRHVLHLLRGLRCMCCDGRRSGVANNYCCTWRG